MKKFSLGCLAAVVFVAAPLLVSCAGPERVGTLANERSLTLVVQQAVPELTPVDNAPAGPSEGDRLEFVAALSIDGSAAGELTGVLTVTRLSSDDGGIVTREERTGSLMFRFNATDSLEVNGNSRYKKGKKEMEVGEPQVRKVIGGTGTYDRSKGSVTTVHNADGTYTHTFSLRLRA